MGKKTPVCSQNNKLANPEVEMLQMKWEHPSERCLHGVLWSAEHGLLYIFISTH